MSVADRIYEVRERIARGAQAAGRSVDSVKLVAVCKRQPLERIVEALAAGLEDLGESTAQGLRATADALESTPFSPRWHFVGALQRNKLNAVLPLCDLFHSVDRASLANAISDRAPTHRAQDANPRVPVLVQVNVGSEPQKAGVLPDDAVSFARSIAALPGLELRGLMAIPPRGDQNHFQAMARLLEELRMTPEGEGATELSMGMSEDFEAAIRSGATIVRVGTGIFGERLNRTAT